MINTLMQNLTTDQLEAELRRRKEAENEERNLWAWKEAPLLTYWKVTTEVDCEGRIMKTLGYFYGTPADILRYLIANNITPGYQFFFERIEDPVVDVSKQDQYLKDFHGEAHISLDDRSGTWKMKAENRAKIVQEYFGDTATVTPSNYFSAVRVKV